MPLAPSRNEVRPPEVLRRAPRPPSSVDWLVAVVGLILHQNGAFVSVPLMMSGDSLRVTVNPTNTVAVTVWIALLVLVFPSQIRRMASLARQNLASMLFLVLVLQSALWSIHPDITIRRGAGYLLTLTFAAYLVVRFDIERLMRALSASFAVTAIGSLVFVVLFPQSGIMQVGELAGAWRGVFPHKNALGPAMALAVFVELYVILASARLPKGRVVLLTLYVALVFLSQSATAMLLSVFYGGGAVLYAVWRRNRLTAVVAVVNLFLITLAAGLVLASDPESALNAIGKDATLTGRTTVWDIVLAFIRERPVLGWGYRAMWVVGDPTTTFAEGVTGQWGVSSSHNSFLELILQLGFVGLAVMVVILGSGLWRGVCCWRAGIQALGWLAIVYTFGIIVAAQTVETLGRSQEIAWLLFSILLFACGRELARTRAVWPSTAS